MSEPNEIENVAPEATAAAPEAVQTPDAAAPSTPAPIQHNPYLARQALDLGISQEEIAQTDPDTLQRTVFHLTRQAMSVGRSQPVQQPARPEPEPEPEPDLGLSPTELAELQELNPVLLKALKKNALAAAKAEQVEKEVRAIRQQTAGQDLARRVQAEMNKFAAALGVGTAYEQPRKDAVLHQLGVMEQQGMIGANTPPEVAVPMAVNLLFGAAVPTPPSPSPPRPTPTPTARPTNRINAADDEVSRDTLVDAWGRWQRAQAEKEKTAGKDGEFRP